MKILTYRDLESKDGLVPLLDHAFRWVFDQRKFEDSIKIDPRLKNGPVSFCAVENGRILGHVGVLDLNTRTIDGTLEKVGGIYGVATLPGYTRKGISTALMNRAHQYFKEKDYRFCFLGTSPVLVAHALYEKLGYTDLIEYPNAYKVVKTKKAKSSGKRKVAKFSFDKLLRIYNEFTKEKTGFVIRDKAYLRMLRKVEEIKAKQCLIDEEGYVIFREDKQQGLCIRELVALNVKEVNRLISMIEERAKGSVYDRAVLNPAVLEVYRSRGYMIQDRGYGVLMYRSLTANASFEETYGSEFYLSRLDTF